MPLDCLTRGADFLDDLVRTIASGVSRAGKMELQRWPAGDLTRQVRDSGHKPARAKQKPQSGSAPAEDTTEQTQLPSPWRTMYSLSIARLLRRSAFPSGQRTSR